MAGLRPVDGAYVRERLGCNGKLIRLFHTMSVAEQHHGIAVSRALEWEGHSDADLLAAALLHDVGKTLTPPSLLERVIVVLVERCAPRLARRWGDGEPTKLRRGFVVRRRHAEWGAALAAEAGATTRTVALVRRHHIAAGTDSLLAALQAADEA